MKRRRAYLGLGLGVLATTIFAYARPADALYRYFSRKNLAHALDEDAEKWVDKDVTVTDEITWVWPESAEMTDTPDGGKRLLRFDTTYFRCAIDPSKAEYVKSMWEDAKVACKDIFDKMEELTKEEAKSSKDRKKSDADIQKERKELASQLHTRWKAHPIVTVFGKVSRPDFYTPNFYGDAKKKPDEDAKSRAEHVVIVLEKAEKPRERFYNDIDE